MKYSAATAQLDERRNNYVVRQTLGNLAFEEGYDQPGSFGISSLYLPTRFDVGRVWGQGYSRDPFQLSTSSTTAVSNVAVFGISEVGREIGTAPKIDINSIINRKITEAIDRLLTIAKDEKFQDGMESNLSLGFSALIGRYPLETLSVITDRLKSKAMPYLIFAEILRVLGRIENEISKEGRFVLLISHLWHKSAIVRDAASVGLSFMNDRRAITQLRMAIESETVPSLREDMEGVADQLEK